MRLDPTILKRRVPKTFDNGTTKKTKERTTHYPGPNDPTFWAGGIPEGIRILLGAVLVYFNTTWSYPGPF